MFCKEKSKAIKKIQQYIMFIMFTGSSNFNNFV